MKTTSSVILKQDEGKGLSPSVVTPPPMGTANLYLYIKTTRVGKRKYRYLIIEEYLGQGKRRPLLKLSVDEAIKRLLWCGGWDSNPRRPTPSGPKPDAPSESSPSEAVFLKQHDADTLNEFLAYCVKSASKETCRQYITYIQRGYDEGNKWSVLAWKKFTKWLCNERGVNDACTLYEKIKTKRSGVDLYVPDINEVRETLENADEPYRNVYLVLLQSGLRLKEATFLIRNIDRLRTVEVNGFIRVELNMLRGSKKAFWGYLLSLPPKTLITDKEVSEYARRNGLLAPKYIRKFVATTMAKLGIPEAAIEFVQGRTPDKIIRRHYYDRLALADQEYTKYKEFLLKEFKEFL